MGCEGSEVVDLFVDTPFWQYSGHNQQEMDSKGNWKEEGVTHWNGGNRLLGDLDTCR